MHQFLLTGATPKLAFWLKRLLLCLVHINML